MERLISRLANGGDCSTAERIAEDIVRAIEEYAGEIPARRQPHDDRTIVVLRVAGETE